MLIDFEQLEATKIYHWMTQTVIPRPVAWVLSENSDKGLNLAPFSYFTAVSSSPPLLMISVGKKPDASIKDTRANLVKDNSCVVHIAPKSLAKDVTESSRTLAYGESELERINLPLEPFEGFTLPRLADCPIAYGCTVHDVLEVGSVPQALIFLKIQHLFINDAVMTKDEKGRHKVNTLAVDPIARLGANEYATLGDVISIPRPA